MLHVYFGSDEITIREKAFAQSNALKGDGGEVLVVGSANYEPGILSDLLGSVSLFGGEKVVVFDTLSESKEVFEDCISCVKELGASKNHFILIEGTLLAGDKKKLSGHADTFVELTKEKGETFNAFSLTDAYTARDKKRLWLLLNEAWQYGLSNEEIAGVLFWQIKILRLVARTKSAEEAGQKPFVYDKAKRALQNFKPGELDQMSRDLLAVYHDGHNGKCDMRIALEKWVLQL